MEKNELIEKLNAALAEEFEVETELMVPEASLKEVLQLDSLSMVDLVALVESQFNTKIENEAIGTIKTFGNLYDYVYDKVQA